ncbi:DUF1772 domain-containing protein [Tessaracoccus flavescens]|uniref:Uncharacterized protein n=1 Tax=Tessaracoccus flavescens TaxID=399497 RepID=A0A1Q2CYG1_9ACTN|nr:hypothetical protein BW733_09785 [Tessaracoccus flavescens]
MALLFGGAAAAAAVLVAQVATGRSPLALVGAGLALASFVVTVTVKVPLNNVLARAVGDGGWPRFARRWGRANLLRAALSAAGGLPRRLTVQRRMNRSPGRAPGACRVL